MKPWLRRLLFTPILLVVGLLLLEGLARLVMAEAVMTTIPSDEVKAHITLGGDIVYDPILGWKRSVLPNPGLGLDRNGFRHPQVEREKPPGVVRGFAVGDSQTYGAGVLPGEAYPAVAEATLRAEGFDVELINAGLSGYHSRQALRLFKTQLIAFDPDFLVVDCQGRDDVHDDQPPQSDALRDSFERAVFYSRLYRGLRLGVQQVSARLHPGEKADLLLPSFSFRSPLGSAEPHPGNHDLILDYAQARGIEVFFLDYPFGNSPPQALVRAADLPRGARLVHTVPALIATGAPTPELFHDNNHMTARGNAVAGAELAKAVAEWLRSRSTPGG